MKENQTLEKYKDTVTIMLVRRDALKRFKKLAVEMQRPMTVLHDQLSKVSASKLKELLDQ